MPSKAVKKKEYPSRYDMSVIRAFAGAVSSAYADYGLDICDFLHKAMKTNLFKNFEEEFTVHSQGAHCIAGKILEEINEPVKAALANILLGILSTLFPIIRVPVQPIKHELLISSQLVA